jgi:predicted nucleic acid-binding Zn ribbon protein
VDKKKVNINPGAQLAALRAVERKACAECGEPIVGLKTKKFCSEACKQRAKYRRKKESGA